MLKNPSKKFKLKHLRDALLKTMADSSMAQIHQLLTGKLKGQQTVHIILTASSGVAAKLRTGSQPTSSKLTDEIGEQATPNDPRYLQGLPLITLQV
jgi:hypothetical protein